jgi:hypothetical protein
MAYQLFAGLLAEGNTDNRFLEGVVTRTFHDIGFECQGDLEIEVIILNKTSSVNFVDLGCKAAEKGFAHYSITMLCVHSDADDRTNDDTYRNKINPAKEALQALDETTHCKVMVPIVPIQMIEAWMLADLNLLKREIGTLKSDRELGLDRPPESFADPKAAIQTALQIALQDQTRRHRRSLQLGELYAPLGQKISLERLKDLPSFQLFVESLRDAFRQCNLLI